MVVFKNKKYKSIVTVTLTLVYVFFTYQSYTSKNSGFDDSGSVTYGWPLKYKTISYDDISWLYDCDDPAYSRAYAEAQASGDRALMALLYGCDDDELEYNRSYLMWDIIVSVALFLTLLIILWLVWKI